MQIDKITAFGHPNILSNHKTTVEFTKEKHLTKKGDCIVAINADKSIQDISDELKSSLKKNKKIKCKIYTNNYTDEIIGYGDKYLTFNHPTDIVLRKSNYICPRTLLINCNKAACDINRDLIEELQKNEKLSITFHIYNY